jgi:hypothetical protein
MPRVLSTEIEIDEFVRKVISEAEHHGGRVAHVIEPLSIAVRARLINGVDKVEVFERKGRLARTCWVTISKKRYAFSYDYEREKIQLKKGSTQGPVIQLFDNDTHQSVIDLVIARM